MTEQELFETMNKWARIHGVIMHNPSGSKIKEEEPPFALPVGLLSGKVLAANPHLKESIEATTASGELWGDKLMDDLSRKVQQENAQSMSTPARSKILDEILQNSNRTANKEPDLDKVREICKGIKEDYPPAAGEQSVGKIPYALSDEGRQMTDDDVEYLMMLAKRKKEAREAAVEKFETVSRVIDGKLRLTNIPKRLDSLSKEEILARLGSDRPGIIPPQGGSGTAPPARDRHPRPVPDRYPFMDGPYKKWLTQLWQNPTENWETILNNLAQERAAVANDWKGAFEAVKVTRREAREKELADLRQELEKKHRNDFKKKFQETLFALTPEQFQLIQTIKECGRKVTQKEIQDLLGLREALGIELEPLSKSDSLDTQEKRSTMAKEALKASRTGGVKYHPDALMGKILEDRFNRVCPEGFPSQYLENYYCFCEEIRIRQLRWLARPENDWKELPSLLTRADPNHPDEEMRKLNIKRLALTLVVQHHPNDSLAKLSEIDAAREKRLKELSGN